jgi:hypothetical protein
VRLKRRGQSPALPVASARGQRVVRTDGLNRLREDSSGLSFRGVRQATGMGDCQEDARSALECGSGSYRLVFVECKAAAPLRFAAALQGASRIMMSTPVDHPPPRPYQGGESVGRGCRSSGTPIRSDTRACSHPAGAGWTVISRGRKPTDVGPRRAAQPRKGLSNPGPALSGPNVA